MNPMPERDPVLVIGAGLVGPVLAAALARRGHPVQVVDRRLDPRVTSEESSRSVNLVISRRGWSVLETLGMEERVRAIGRPLRGRTVHPSAFQQTQFQPYSRSGEHIWCVERPALNALLLDMLDELPGVALRFGQRCRDIDLEHRRVAFSRMDEPELRWESTTRVLAADGAFSGARQSLLYGRFNYSQSYMAMGYKQFLLPAQGDGGPALALDTFHVWPRDTALVGAFPNADGSFTGSLFMLHEGEHGFEGLERPGAALRFVAEMLPDLRPWQETICTQLEANPVTPLVTIRARPWVQDDFLALVGDAAHAILPFFGQGMNCGFEDAHCLVRCLDETEDDRGEALRRYEAERRPNADAIADMSLEHFRELSGSGEPDPDPDFRLLVESALYEHHSDRFAPLYERVAFSEMNFVDARSSERERRRIVSRILSIPGIRQCWADMGPVLLNQAVESGPDNLDRIPLLIAMLEEAMADGVITPDEEALLERVAKVLNLQPEDVERARELVCSPVVGRSNTR